MPTPHTESDQLLDLAADITLLLGIFALGLGTAFHLALMWTQGAVVETTQVSLEMQAGSLYPILTRMQWAANTSLTTGALALVGGGVLATRDQVRDTYTQYIKNA